MSQRAKLATRLAGCLGVGLVLLAVFGMYLRPDVMVMLADQVWACF